MPDEVKTTRLELIETRGRIKLAEKGRKLLTQKRDVLVLEFFKVIKESKDLRNVLNAKMKEAFTALAMARAYHGIVEIENISLSVEKAPDVLVEDKNIMGVHIPKIKIPETGKRTGGKGYGINAGSAKIDEAADAFQECLAMVVKLAETENAIKRFVKEIEKTKRKVNALDYSLIPQLRKNQAYIVMRLEEMEREQFISLKMIKNKLTGTA